MASARQIAEMLTKQFLDEGNFSDSGEVAWIIPIEDVLQCFGGMELVGNLGM